MTNPSEIEILFLNYVRGGIAEGLSGWAGMAARTLARLSAIRVKLPGRSSAEEWTAALDDAFNRSGFVVDAALICRDGGLRG